MRSAPEQPFFLTVGFVETHRKFPEPAPEDDPDHTLPPAPLPDAPETRRDFAAFKASARAYDTGVGVVLDALAESGLEGNTLVILTTDHGIAFPRMKCNLQDSGIGVLLVMRGPGGFAGGKASDALVSHVDVFPTLCDLLEIDPPGWLEGRSLMPLVRGGAAQVSEEVNDEIFSEVTYHAAYEPMRCVRTRRWKY
ncbi:MAG: sulfatase-like hydrolase/transferase, partial [Planctomycetota bacterium]